MEQQLPPTTDLQGIDLEIVVRDTMTNPLDQNSDTS